MSAPTKNLQAVLVALRTACDEMTASRCEWRLLAKRLEAERNALALQVSILTNERDEARALAVARL